jgi:hypothetical protein
MDDAVMVGNAGEFFVLAELTRRGWTAAMTARNNRAYDILARKREAQVSLRVKTKTWKANVFRWNAKKDGTIFLDLSRKGDFCVLVDIPEGTAYPDFYVVPSHEVDGWLHADFKKYLTIKGPKGQEHSPNSKIRLFYIDDDGSRCGHGYGPKLKKYRDAWNIMER